MRKQQPRKKQEPSQAYYDLLVRERGEVLDSLEVGKQELYKLTVTAKLGEYEFEQAREECLKWTNELKAIDKEIDRVQKAVKITA